MAMAVTLFQKSKTCQRQMARGQKFDSLTESLSETRKGSVCTAMAVNWLPPNSIRLAKIQTDSKQKKMDSLTESV